MNNFQEFKNRKRNFQLVRMQCGSVTLHETVLRGSEVKAVSVGTSEPADLVKIKWLLNFTWCRNGILTECTIIPSRPIELNIALFFVGLFRLLGFFLIEKR